MAALADAGIEPGRRARAGPALLRVQRRASTTSGPRRREPSAGVELLAHRLVAPRARLPRLPDRRRCAEARATVPAEHKVLFTAHSLPERVLVDDPYPDQLRESAAAVAERVGLLPWPDWAIAWQSAGRTPEPWRGPDILDGDPRPGRHRPDRRRRRVRPGLRRPITSRCSTTSTSRRRRVADEHGLAFARTRSLNDDPTVMAALADRRARAAPADGRRPDACGSSSSAPASPG